MDYFEYLAIALPKLAQGLLITFQVTLVSLAIGVLIGVPAAFARVYGPPWLKRIVVTFIEIMRGTPVLVQLFLVYYGLPQFGVTLTAFTSAYIALGLNSGAYQTEYFRGAIQAISSGQMLAARSIGMTRMQAIRRVIMPQALRLAIPAWSNEVVSMIKISSILYLVAVSEMMTVAKELYARYFNPFQTYITVGIVYLIIIGIITYLLNLLEKRVKIPGIELDNRSA